MSLSETRMLREGNCRTRESQRHWLQPRLLTEPKKKQANRVIRNRVAFCFFGKTLMLKSRLVLHVMSLSMAMMPSIFNIVKIHKVTIE